jgi:hypothetical protein
MKPNGVRCCAHASHYDLVIDIDEDNCIIDVNGVIGKLIVDSKFNCCNMYDYKLNKKSSLQTQNLSNSLPSIGPITVDGVLCIF